MSALSLRQSWLLRWVFGFVLLATVTTAAAGPFSRPTVVMVSPTATFVYPDTGYEKIKLVERNVTPAPVQECRLFVREVPPVPAPAPAVKPDHAEPKADETETAVVAVAIGCCALLGFSGLAKGLTH